MSNCLPLTGCLVQSANTLLQYSDLPMHQCLIFCNVNFMVPVLGLLFAIWLIVMMHHRYFMEQLTSVCFWGKMNNNIIIKSSECISILLLFFHHQNLLNYSQLVSFSSALSSCRNIRLPQSSRLGDIRNYVNKMFSWCSTFRLSS